MIEEEKMDVTQVALSMTDQFIQYLAGIEKTPEELADFWSSLQIAFDKIPVLLPQLSWEDGAIWKSSCVYKEYLEASKSYKDNFKKPFEYVRRLSANVGKSFCPA